MNGVTIFEFEALAPLGSDIADREGVHEVPAAVFEWLQSTCQRVAEAGEGTWLKPGHRRGRMVVQVTSFVGVIQAPGGFQIEVLPKIGNAIEGGIAGARGKLIDMLCCLPNFRHVKTTSARLAAAGLPLLEVFIGEFLHAVRHVVKRGLRSDYRQQQGNLFALRGKLLVSRHLRENLCRSDRFFTEHDEFSIDRPENRLLRSAVQAALAMARTRAHQQLASELRFALGDVPASDAIDADFQRVRLDRGMNYYAEALAWAKLILAQESPLTSSGAHRAPSLLFPMEALFEAFVAYHLKEQLAGTLALKTQARSHHLVRHNGQDWFRLKPDLLVSEGHGPVLVLDTKWKLIDRGQDNGSDKYGLAPADFYQLYAYGQTYLNGSGDVALIYPRTDSFATPLPAFDFPSSSGLRLWVLPFCLDQCMLAVPEHSPVRERLRLWATTR